MSFATVWYSQQLELESRCYYGILFSTIGWHVWCAERSTSVANGHESKSWEGGQLGGQLLGPPTSWACKPWARRAGGQLGGQLEGRLGGQLGGRLGGRLGGLCSTL